MNAIEIPKGGKKMCSRARKPEDGFKTGKNLPGKMGNSSPFLKFPSPSFPLLLFALPLLSPSSFSPSSPFPFLTGSRGGQEVL